MIHRTGTGEGRCRGDRLASDRIERFYPVRYQQLYVSGNQRILRLQKQDAITDFVRSLDSPYRVAFYSYSRDFYRASSLTPDRSQVLRAARATVNGDESALYNALLMTLKDASQYSGRKVVVVFSNGPDNSSMVPPEDVDELAQSEGIPIYMISTREAKLDPSTSAVFGRLSATTGGSAYYAKSWQDERQAFSSIREDLQHLYYLSYYPQANPNRGWRAISVKLKDKKYRKYTNSHPERLSSHSRTRYHRRGCGHAAS